MTFQVRPKPMVATRDVRLTVPADIAEAVERLASNNQVEPAEVYRQALAYALRTEIRPRTRSRGGRNEAEG